MLSGHRSAWRRRGRNSRAARLAVPLAIPMALGLTLGIILAVSGGHVSKIQQSAMGASASPSASASGGVGRCLGDADRHGSGGGGAGGGHLRQRAGRHAPARRPGDGPGRRYRRRDQPEPDGGGSGRVDELHPDRAGQPAQRAGPRHAVAARRRLLDGERRHRGRVRRGHHPVPERPAAGVQPAGHHGGNHGGGHAGGADDRARFPGDHRCRLQRHQPGPSGPGRPAGPLRRRARPVLDRPGVGVQRRQLLQPGQLRDRAGHADGPAGGHFARRPAVPDHA